MIADDQNLWLQLLCMIHQTITFHSATAGHPRIGQPLIRFPTLMKSVYPKRYPLVTWQWTIHQQLMVSKRVSINIFILVISFIANCSISLLYWLVLIYVIISYYKPLLIAIITINGYYPLLLTLMNHDWWLLVLLRSLCSIFDHPRRRQAPARSMVVLGHHSGVNNHNCYQWLILLY